MGLRIEGGFVRACNLMVIEDSRLRLYLSKVYLLVNILFFIRLVRNKQDLEEIVELPLEGQIKDVKSQETITSFLGCYTLYRLPLPSCDKEFFFCPLYCKGLCISSLYVLGCSFHVGYKWHGTWQI